MGKYFILGAVASTNISHLSEVRIRISSSLEPTLDFRIGVTTFRHWRHTCTTQHSLQNLLSRFCSWNLASSSADRSSPKVLQAARVKQLALSVNTPARGSMISSLVDQAWVLLSVSSTTMVSPLNVTVAVNGTNLLGGHTHPTKSKIIGV